MCAPRPECSFVCASFVFDGLIVWIVDFALKKKCALVQRARSVVEDVPPREKARSVAWHGGEWFGKAQEEKGQGGSRRSVKNAATTTTNPQPSSSIGAGLSFPSLGTVTLVGSEESRRHTGSGDNASSWDNTREFRPPQKLRGTARLLRRDQTQPNDH